MNIALFTSNHLRHKYVAAKIAEKLKLKLIVSEVKSTAIQDSTAYNSDDKTIVDTHFEDRDNSETQFFEDYDQFPKGIFLMNIPNKALSSQEVIEALNAHDIDVILLFGSSIVKPVILDKYPQRVLNLHLGLSPYYKGSGTNFFPIVNNEFGCIGATFHLASSKVDAGNILHQFRLNTIEKSDTIYSLGNKVIYKAGLLYPEIVKRFLDGEIKTQPQPDFLESKEYHIKDFTPEAIKKAKAVILEGGILNYLENQSQKKELKPIFSNCNE